MKDHREIGREMDLFSFHEEAPGAIFWHPKGWIIYRTLQEFIRTKIKNQGYEEISTPAMVKSQLFKKSGHWEHFGEHNMFNLPIWEDEEIIEVRKKIEQNVPGILEKYNKFKTPNFSFPISIKGSSVEILIEFFNEGRQFRYSLPVNYSLKPMNCPEACLIYATRPRSYNELPVKFAEFGILHRRELSGVLGGAMRVRQFMIDDAHLFVRTDQIQQEINKLLLMVSDFYKSLDLKPQFYFSTKPDKAMGDLALWKEAEENLETALKNTRVKYGTKEKDGAFYGPKIDIHITDSQNRDWQVATIQLDFQTPLQMDLSFIDKDGKKKTPIMIHRGIFGSFERFIGILTEHFQGAFPYWLAPIQVAVLPVSEKHNDRAKQIDEELKKNEVRTLSMDDNKTLGAKIREATLQKIPYMIIIGDKEEQIAKSKDQKELYGSVRTREGKNLGLKNINDFLKTLKENIEK